MGSTVSCGGERGPDAPKETSRTITPALLKEKSVDMVIQELQKQEKFDEFRKMIQPELASLMPEDLIGTLTVKVHRAFKLLDVDALGKQDPFVKVMIGPDFQQTEVKYDSGTSAEWNESLSFSLDYKKNPTSEVELQVLDDNEDGNHVLIGSLKGNIIDMLRNPQPFWYQLKRRDDPAGDIELSFLWKASAYATASSRQRAQFDRYDVNRSGYIEFEELENMLRQLYKPSKRDMKYFLQHFDRNNDGEISFKEFKLGMKKIFLRFQDSSKNDETEIVLRNLFNRFDKDKSGTISGEAELIEACKAITEFDTLTKRKVFIWFDRDRDDRISFEEFQVGLEKFDEELSPLLAACQRAQMDRRALQQSIQERSKALSESTSYPSSVGNA